MDPLEPLDDAAAEMNDPEFSAAVAEVEACYKELFGPNSRTDSDTKAIFDRLEKAAAISRRKIAERDAKREAQSGMETLAYKKKMEEERNSKVADFKEKLKENVKKASEGDHAAACLVEAQEEMERETGMKMEEIYKSLFD